MRTAALRRVSCILSVSLGLVLSGCGGSAAPVVTISPSASQAIDQGQTLALTAAVANDTNSDGVSWSVSGGGTLTGGTTTSVTYNAPSTVSSATTVTVTATSVAQSTVTATHTITVNPAPAVTTSTLPAGTVGVAYSTTLTATGGSGTPTWTVNSGTLPTGLTLSSAGVLSGTVTSATGPSTTTLTFKVTDASAATPLTATSGSLTLTINPVTLAINAPTLANGIVGTAYTSAAYTTTGGTGAITWSETGLPAGLSINSSTGVISGNPTTAATYSSVVITATDSGASPFQQTKSTTAVSVTVYPTLTIGTLSAATAVQGVTALNIAAPTVGGGFGSYTYSATGLPAGVSIAASTGIITGTPTTATGSPFSVSVSVTDSGTPSQTKSTSFTLTVIPTLSINVPTLANGVQTVAYTSAAFTATGGTGSITWSATGLPAGLSMNASTGVISGTTGGAATTSNNVVVTATDSGTPPYQQTKSTAALTLTVVSKLALTTITPPGGTVGLSYSYTLVASGGATPYTYGATGLPAGLSINATTGAITGTPTAVASGAVTLSVSDSTTPTAQTASASPTLTVVAGTPVITTTTLPTASLTIPYSQQLVVNPEGQTGSTTWAVVSGLPADGLSLNTSTGVISGTPSSTSGSPLSVVVTATVGAVTSAPQTLSLSVLAGPVITTTTLAPAYVNQAYSATLNSTGGAGSNTWSVTAGQPLLTTLGLTLTGNGNTATLTGTPTTTGSGNVTFQVKDSNNATNSATLAVGAYNVLALPTPNPITLPAGTTASSYTGSIAVSGGVGPNYAWQVNSTTLTNNTPLPISSGGVTGLSVSTTGNNTLTVSGTPVGTGTVTLNVSVTDGANTTVSKTYTIAVSTTYSITGQIHSTSCYTGVSGVTVALSGVSTGSTTTDSNGNFSFTGLATGAYVVTPSITGASSVFYPATQSINISSSNASTFFNATIGYNVSGTVSYSGSKTGRVYLALNSTSCSNGGGTQGTSVALSSGSGTYTIHGVAPGTYTLQAYMDNLSNGTTNASNPTGSTGSVTVGAANVTGANVTLSDPASVTLSSGPQLNGAIAFNNGAFVSFQPITNNSGTELATSYTVQYSTSSTFASGVTSLTVPATGTHGANGVVLVNGLTNGTGYYFRVYATSGGTPTSADSSTFGPLTINAPSGGATVSGTVTTTLPNGVSLTGPMYVGFYNQNSGILYGEYIASPTTSQTYSVNVPTSSSAVYEPVVVIDQNRDGAIDVGDIQNTNGNGSALLAITGATTVNQTIAATNSTIALTTANDITVSGSGSSSETYSLNVQDQALLKLPVSVSVTSSTNTDGANVVTTTDVATCAATNNCGQGFQLGFSLAGVAPTVGDTYSVLVTYLDGSTETLTPSISTVLGASAFATSLAPRCAPTCTSTSTTPTFTWTYPTADTGSNYTYSFYLSGPSGSVWQIPANNSNSGNFYSGQVPMPAGIPWNTDPTGGNSLPSVGSLTLGQTYYWQIQTQDINGNTATRSVQYTP